LYVIRFLSNFQKTRSRSFAIYRDLTPTIRAIQVKSKGAPEDPGAP
jgi:hypothetical protein